MRTLDILSHAEEETVALAQKLASAFVPGDVVILTGELGSGKTTFVRALTAARGIDDSLVNSPSYTFINEYPGEPPIYHFDLYRLADESELNELGWDEYLGREGLMLVEWGEKAGESLPARYYHIVFSIGDDTERKIEISLVNG